MTLKEKIKGLSQDEAIVLLSTWITEHPEDDEALTLRGMKLWGSGRRGEAMTDYLTALRINPQSNARQALQAAQEILNYRNKDLYNP